MPGEKSCSLGAFCLNLCRATVAKGCPDVECAADAVLRTSRSAPRSGEDVSTATDPVVHGARHVGRCAVVSSGSRAKEPSLLTGLVRDADGRRLVPSHAVKLKRRYRYYITQLNADAVAADPGPAHSAPTLAPTLRLPAANLERLVQERLNVFFSDPKAILHSIDGWITDAVEHRGAFARGQELANGWDEQPVSERRVRLQTLLTSVVVYPDHITLSLNISGLHRMLIGTPLPPRDL